jgi:hypothetical protein
MTESERRDDNTVIFASKEVFQKGGVAKPVDAVKR